MNDLGELEQERESLLMAEVAAWLHDYRKHTDQHISKWVNRAPEPSGIQDAEDLIPSFPVTLLGQTIEFSKVRKRGKADFVRYYLNRCHNTAHIEKPEGGLTQSYPSYLSSPFGYESDTSIVPGNLTKIIRCHVNWSLLAKSPFMPADQDNFRNEIFKFFSCVGGDTRRPVNEITLWEWGHTVSAFYKAALVGSILGFQPDANDLHWRLLSIRFDGFAFFAQSVRLPDLLARRNLLIDVLDEIRQLLEFTYPIGTEVYRDENGSIFIVPGCEKGNCTLNLLDQKNGSKTLSEHILDCVRILIEGELVPDISIDREPWYGQDPDWRQKQKQHILPDDDLPRVSEHLNPLITGQELVWVNQQWKGKEEQICTVCGLRPMGPAPKSRDRHVCDVCEQRRENRSKEWATEKLNTTIWNDEVADANAHIALIVGRFDLTHWLSGDLVRTLSVKDPANATDKIAKEIAKNPSFARLRRIWETTHRFWQEVCPTSKDGKLQESVIGNLVGRAGPRLEIRGKLSPNERNATLGPYHAYELGSSTGLKLSAVWDPEEGKSDGLKGRLITIDNLAYVAKLMEKKAPPKNEDESERDYSLRLQRWGADVVKREIRNSLIIEESKGYGTENKDWGEIAVKSVAIIADNAYVPAIPILAEPQTFMTLLPANEALKMVGAIKAKYEREMGKVRNRLSLHLGIVYAGRRMPIRAVLDAGRRMLEQDVLGEVDAWKVLDDITEESGTLPKKSKYLSEGSSQFNKWYAVCLEHQKINRKLTWYVPAVMGDGTTPDNWYPYLFWIEDKDRKTEPSYATTPRSRYYEARNPWTNSDGWLVHAGELKKDDVVYFTPATLDFQWLDSAGRRFDISYDEGGRRRGLFRRPYLLDELGELEHIWETLKHHLSKNQIYALRDLIEAKRAEWQEMTPVVTEFDLKEQLTQRSDDVFWRFCYDVLANAEWQKGKKDEHKDKMPWQVDSIDRDIWLARWANYLARGWFSDVVELHLQIMKEEVQI